MSVEHNLLLKKEKQKEKKETSTIINFNKFVGLCCSSLCEIQNGSF